MLASDFIVEVPLASLDDDDDDDSELSEEVFSRLNLHPSGGSTKPDGSMSRKNEPTFSTRYSSFGFDTQFSYSNSARSFSDENFTVGNCDSYYDKVADADSDEITPDMDTFSDTMAGSLENLVTCFDEKVVTCLKNLKERTDIIAPVSTEQTYSSDQHYHSPFSVDGAAKSPILPPLKLQCRRAHSGSTDSCIEDCDGDMVSGLNLGNLNNTDRSSDNAYSTYRSTSLNSPETADQVIDEIDRIMQQSCDSEYTSSSDYTMDSVSPYSPVKPLPFASSLNCSTNLNGLSARAKSYASFSSSIDELKSLPIAKLKSYRFELESLIQIYNETLVHELALRDELDYEKELKNTFISLMSAIQSKKRKYHAEHKRKSKSAGHVIGLSMFNAFGQQTNAADARTVPQYLTTVVPYEVGVPMSNQTLEALIKVLRAINDDNPVVPTLLTDYILNVLCPTK